MKTQSNQLLQHIFVRKLKDDGMVILTSPLLGIFIKSDVHYTQYIVKNHELMSNNSIWQF